MGIPAGSLGTVNAEVRPGWAGSWLSRAAAQAQALLTVQGRAGPTNTALLTQQHGTNTPSSPQWKTHPSQPKTSRGEELQEAPSGAGTESSSLFLHEVLRGAPGQTETSWGSDRQKEEEEREEGE